MRDWPRKLGFSLCVFVCACNHPVYLNRYSAKQMIEDSARFVHGTKLSFEIGQLEGLFPGVCHIYSFPPSHQPLWNSLLADGSMKFIKSGGQGPPYMLDEKFGSMDLYVGRLLDVKSDACKPLPATAETGFYEVTVGDPTVEINGIRDLGNGYAKVDFIWHFASLNDVGKALPRIRALQDFQEHQEHWSDGEKSLAPFWNGTATLVKYDDGWRISNLDLGWDYGPSWPDPYFNWGGSDEDENIAR